MVSHAKLARNFPDGRGSPAVHPVYQFVAPQQESISNKKSVDVVHNGMWHPQTRSNNIGSRCRQLLVYFPMWADTSLIYSGHIASKKCSNFWFILMFTQWHVPTPPPIPLAFSPTSLHSHLLTFLSSPWQFVLWPFLYPSLRYFWHQENWEKTYHP